LYIDGVMLTGLTSREYAEGYLKAFIEGELEE